MREAYAYLSGVMAHPGTKLYRNLAEAVVAALQRIFDDGQYADKVIERTLKQNPKWGARDRRFIAETTYDIVRWYRLLRETTAARQDDYWRLVGGWCVMHNIALPPWPELAGLSAGEIRERASVSANVRKIRESIPDWLDEVGEQQLGEKWDQELAALNEPAEVVLRVNRLKASPEEVQQRLDVIRSHTLDDQPDALVLEERQNIFRHPIFKEGLVEVQDAASQLVAPFLQAAPGMRVIDACAGAGGKTLHLAAMMHNKGRIIAMDVEGWKLEELQKRARRAGISNLETRSIESAKTIKRLAGSADRLLLDVPCSGLGVLKRNPDAKWKLSPSFIKDIMEVQRRILDDYCVMLKPGGILVYATCSILPEENEQQVQQFLSTHDNFTLVLDKRCWPSEGYDGFYMARLQKAL